MTQPKEQIIRCGDKFMHGEDIFEVTRTLPGGKLEMFCRQKTRFLSSYHRIVKTWERVK